jgi:transposase-like protein
MAKQGGKRHGAEQIVRKLRDAEALLCSGKTIGEACQSLEVSEQTFHRWRKKYGGMKAEEAKRLEELEQENGRLKKLVADLSLDVQMLKEIARGNF